MRRRAKRCAECGGDSSVSLAAAMRCALNQKLAIVTTLTFTFTKGTTSCWLVSERRLWYADSSLSHTLGQQRESQRTTTTTTKKHRAQNARRPVDAPLSLSLSFSYSLERWTGVFIFISHAVGCVVAAETRPTREREKHNKRERERKLEDNRSVRRASVREG